MLSNALPCPQTQYSLGVVQEEARQLVYKGIISRQQPISILCQYIPPRDWIYFATQLEASEYLLRDRIGDLLSYEEWRND